MKNKLKTVIGIIVVVGVILGICVLDRQNIPMETETESTKTICEQGDAVVLRKGFVYDDINKKSLCGYYEEEFNENGQCVAYRLYEMQLDSEEDKFKLIKEERYIYIYNPRIGVWERFLKEKSLYTSDEEPKWVTFEYKYEFDKYGNIIEVSEIYVLDYINKQYVNKQLYCEYTHGENTNVYFLTLYDKETNKEDGFYVYDFNEEGKCIGRRYREKDSEGYYLGHSIEWYEWGYNKEGEMINEIFTLYESTYDYRQIETEWDETGNVISLNIYERKNRYQDKILMQFDGSGNCIGGDLYRYDFGDEIQDTQYIYFEYQNIQK